MKNKTEEIIKEGFGWVFYIRGPPVLKVLKKCTIVVVGLLTDHVGVGKYLTTATS